VKKRLWHLLVGTRGGIKRAEILGLVKRRPYNAHEIARLLGVDYKTARHHLRVLVENDLLKASDERYGTLYSWSPALAAHEAEWHEIAEALARSVARPAPKSQPDPPNGSDA